MSIEKSFGFDFQQLLILVIGEDRSSCLWLCGANSEGGAACRNLRGVYAVRWPDVHPSVLLRAQHHINRTDRLIQDQDVSCDPRVAVRKRLYTICEHEALIVVRTQSALLGLF